MSKTPKLRFKEFSREWEEKKLGDICEIVMGQSPSSSCYNENRIGLPLIQGKADIKDRKTSPRIYTSDITKICDVGDIIMSVRAPVGYISKSCQKSCIGRGVCGIKAKQNREFIYQFLIGYEDKWDKISQGSTFESINRNDIDNTKISIPSLKEQEKISSFLSLIDDKINLQSEKVKYLKDYKKGLMQKIFSRKLRFKNENGNDYPEWEEKKFEELYSSFSTKTYQIKTSQVNNYGKFEVVDQGKENICGYTDRQQNVFYNVPVIVYGDHTTNIKFRDKEFVIGADGTKILGNKDCFNNLNFLFYALDFNNIKSEGYKRHFSILKKIKLDIATSRDEQNKIANLLSSVDKKIEKEQEKLDSLTEYKKGLLQQMFI